jgi:hypothetical protein
LLSFTVLQLRVAPTRVEKGRREERIVTFEEWRRNRYLSSPPSSDRLREMRQLVGDGGGDLKSRELVELWVED